jgi:hypothetical protein
MIVRVAIIVLAVVLSLLAARKALATTCKS